MGHRRALLSLTGLLTLGACGGAGVSSPGSFDWLGGPEHSQPFAGQVMQVRWTKRITSDTLRTGAYVPVQRARAALDPGRNRIYIGSSEGRLLALESTGRRRYSYDAEAPIEAGPAVDSAANEVYVASEDGTVHALRGRTGEVRWKETAGGPVRRAPILTDDVVFVVTDSDVVTALAREDGAVLWSYQRDAPDGFTISGHAGLAVTDDMVITGFSDGALVALDATDGSVQWVLETATDVDLRAADSPRFLDIDTTPLIVGDLVYAASFSGGLYAVDLSNGTLEWRDEARTGAIGLAHTRDTLIITSADEGVVAIDRISRALRWRHALEHGSPTEPIIVGNMVVFGESMGSLMALSSGSGVELGRLDAGSGFSAAPRVVAGMGVVLSNGGRVFAFGI